MDKSKGNCFKCKNGRIKFGELDQDIDEPYELIPTVRPLFGGMYGRCAIGNTQRMLRFWEEYGCMSPEDSAHVHFTCFEKVS